VAEKKEKRSRVMIDRAPVLTGIIGFDDDEAPALWRAGQI
jgi:hypothetical protein